MTDQLLLPGFELSATGLQVSGTPTFEQWEQCGRRLALMEGAVQWWIGDWLNYGEPAYGEKYAQAISPTQAETWRIYAHVAARVGLLIRINNLSWSHHRLVAPFDPPDQTELLRQAATATPPMTYSELKTVIRARLHTDKVQAIAAGLLPIGEFDVICADPPWQYDNSGFDQSAAAHYPTLDVQAICDLPETDPTFPTFADPSVLFLWATSPLLPAAITVMTAWGFDYKTNLVWIKDRAPGLGWWVDTRHELVLMGARGSLIPLEKISSVITAPVSQHSRKPGIVYDSIQRMYPGLRAVELFARAPREGWTCWGNEVPAC